MKIFEKGCNVVHEDRINFVDQRGVFVGYVFESNCCEDFGYTLSKEEPTKDLDFDEVNPEISNLDLYIFDKNFIKSFILRSDDDKATSVAIFKLRPQSANVVDDTESIYLTLYNIQNGYYSHGFVMEDKDGVLHRGSL